MQTQPASTPHGELTIEPPLPRLLRAAAAGALATVHMSLAMLLLKRLLLPDRRLPPDKIVASARHKGGIGSQTRPLHGLLTVAGHFAYGAAAAMPYALLNARLQRLPLRGAVYGSVVWAASYFGLMPALRLYPAPPDDVPERTGVMVLSHLAWGSSLQLLEQPLALTPPSPSLPGASSSAE